MDTVLDTLRARAAEIDDPVVNRSWVITIDSLYEHGLTDRRALLNALNGDDEAAQSLACWALGHLGEGVALDDLVRVMTKSDALAAEAANALCRIKSGRAVPALITLLTSNASEQCRSAAARALGCIGGKPTERSLRRVLGNTLEPASLRGQCAEALGILRAKGAFALLVSTTEDPSPEVRFWSIHALGQLGERAAISTVEPRRGDKGEVDGYGSVGEEAARVLEWLQAVS